MYSVCTCVHVQDLGDWRNRLAYAGPVRLGECVLHLRPPVGALGLLYVEIPAQGRR